MATPAIPKLTLHRHLASVDMKANSSKKPFEAYALLKQVKLKQRRLTSNQIHKHPDLKADPYSSSSKGCPSTENTETPSDSKQGKYLTAKPSFSQKIDKNTARLQQTDKQTTNRDGKPKKDQVIDPIKPSPKAELQPNRDNDNNNIRENLKTGPVAEPLTGGEVLEKSLNLSLSMVEHQLEADPINYKFLEVSTVTRISIENSIDHSSHEEFGVMEDIIPEGFKNIDVSGVQCKELGWDDVEFDSIEMLYLPDLACNLSLSAIQNNQEKNDLSRLSIVDSWLLPDLGLSAIENNDKLEDDSDLKDIDNFIVDDFSLASELSKM